MSLTSSQSLQQTVKVIQLALNHQDLYNSSLHGLGAPWLKRSLCLSFCVSRSLPLFPQPKNIHHESKRKTLSPNHIKQWPVLTEMTANITWSIIQNFLGLDNRWSVKHQRVPPFLSGHPGSLWQSWVQCSQALSTLKNGWLFVVLKTLLVTERPSDCLAGVGPCSASRSSNVCRTHWRQLYKLCGQRRQSCMSFSAGFPGFFGGYHGDVLQLPMGRFCFTQASRQFRKTASILTDKKHPFT